MPKLSKYRRELTPQRPVIKPLRSRRARRGLESRERLPRAMSITRRVYHLADSKSVELARSAYGVRAHVIECQPVTDTQPMGKHGHGANTVDGIACRAPYAAGLKTLRPREVERAFHIQNVWMNLLMVEQDAVERSVNSIIDVVYGKNPDLVHGMHKQWTRTHNRRLVVLLVFDFWRCFIRKWGTTSDDIRGKAESSGDKIPTRFGDDPETCVIGKMELDSVTEDARRRFESGIFKTTTDIQK